MEQPPKRERQEFHWTRTTPSLNTQWPTLFTVDAVEKRTTLSPRHGGTVLSTPPNTGQTQCALGREILAVSASDTTNGREGRETLVPAVPFNRVFERACRVCCWWGAVYKLQLEYFGRPSGLRKRRHLRCSNKPRLWSPH